MGTDPVSSAAAGAVGGAAVGGPVGAAAGAVGGWVWGQYGKEWTDKLLGEAKKRWEKFNWDQAAERYKESLRAQHTTIRILGKSDPVPLEGIFTDVYILDEITARKRYDIEELRKLGEDRFELARQSQERRDGLKLIRQGGNFFILGKPGAGKTTFLRYITLQAVNGQFDKVPIFLSLHAWSMEEKEELLSFIINQFGICNFPDAQPFIEHLLDSDKAIVLFDGLDEVKLEGERRQRLTLLLNNFAKKYRNTQVLITCRNAASEYQFDGFRDVELADFTRDQVHAYARKWFGTDTTKYDAFIAELYEEKNEGLRELCANPLLLSMLCLAFDNTMHFPERRVALYEDATEALLLTWDASKAIRRDGIYRDGMYRQMDRQQKVRLLSTLAAEAFEEGHYFLERRWLVPRIVAHMKNLPGADADGGIDGDAILDAIEAQHGLLVERASNIHAYAHLSFQEYFTAKYIVDNESRGAVRRLIRNHLTGDRWREVFLLTASMLGNADDFFDEMRRSIDRLIADDAKIVNLLAWAAQKATQSKELSQPTLRAICILFVLGLYRDIDRDIDRDLALALDRALHRDIDRDLDRALAFVRALDLDRDLDRDIDRDLALHFALDLDFARDRALDRALHFARHLARHLAYEREHIQRIGLERYGLLSDYLQANQLLLDCLQVAYVDNRREIQGSLLLPPPRVNSV